MHNTVLFLRNQLFGVLVLLGNLMLTGINNIVLYSTLVFTEAGLEPDKAAFATIGIFAGQLLTAGLGVWAMCIYLYLYLNLNISFKTVDFKGKITCLKLYNLKQKYKL